MLSGHLIFSLRSVLTNSYETAVIFSLLFELLYSVGMCEVRSWVGVGD